MLRDLILIAALTFAAGCATAPLPPPIPPDFHDPKSAHVLIVLTSTPDPKLAEGTAAFLSQQFSSFVDEHIASTGDAMVNVVKGASNIENHEAARALAESLHADVVLWGHVFQNATPSIAITETVDMNGVTADHNSRVSFKGGGAAIPTSYPYTLALHATLRLKDQWFLTGGGQFNLMSLSELNFDRLSKEASTMVVPLVMGIRAFEGSHFEAAEALLTKASLGSDASRFKSTIAIYLAANRFARNDIKGALGTLDEGLLSDPSPHVQWEIRMLRGRLLDEAPNVRAAIAEYTAAASLLKDGRECAAAAISATDLWTQIGDDAAALESTDQCSPSPGCATDRVCSSLTRLLIERKAELLSRRHDLVGSAMCRSEAHRFPSASIDTPVGFMDLFRFMFNPQRIFEDLLRRFLVRTGTPGILPDEEIGSVSWSLERNSCASVHSVAGRFFQLLAEKPVPGRPLFPYFQVDLGKVFDDVASSLPPRHPMRLSLTCARALDALTDRDWEQSIRSAQKILQDVTSSKPVGLDAGLISALALLGQGKVSESVAAVKALLPVLDGVLGATAPSGLMWHQFVVSNGKELILPASPGPHTFRPCGGQQSAAKTP